MKISTDKFLNLIIKNKNRYKDYNSIRLQKFNDYLQIQGLVGLIDAIPFFICNNHTNLPGFIEGYEPIGIYDFLLTAKAESLIKKKFPSVPIQSLKTPLPFIELFAIMGSAGSIAYNEESDIDYWVCVDEKKIECDIIEKLKRKLRAIELWITENYNIETHFFLNDISRIKNDIFDSDEDDISGKALGKLLKDEFYRSSILLYGKIPFWWVVPPGTKDDKYDKFFKIIQKSEIGKDYIDIGNLHKIKKEDFLGAGLFQILKSLGNPFKSIIKIGILEKYLTEEDNKNPLLCNILKEKVQLKDYNTNYIDPYILMFNQVFEYYSNKNRDDPFSLEILKRCFYIKINPKLSEINPNDKITILSEKKTKMLEYTKDWNWMNLKLRQMDDFRNWDITALNKFWNSISKIILKSYKKILNNIESQDVLQKYSDEEMRYITRKISSSFSSTGNKIKPAVSFNDNPIEKQLFIESISLEDGSISWLLSKGFVSGSGASKRSIIHKEPNLLAILTWISINRLFQKNTTRVEIKSRYHLLEQNFVRDLLNELTLHFSPKKVNIKNKYFFTDPFPILNFIIINLFTKYPKGIEDIYYLHHNSWGETVYEKYDKEADFAVILTKLLNGAIAHGDKFENCVFMTSPYPYRASKSFKTFFLMFTDVFNFFVNPDTDESGGIVTKKYISGMGGNFVLFSYLRYKGKNKIICNIFDSELKMLYSLSNIQGVKCLIKVSPINPELNHLKIIIDNFRDDAIQIYFQKARKYCYFFVSDERGSIIFFRKNSKHYSDYLTRLFIFTKKVITQIRKNNPSSTFNRKDSKRIEIYNLERGNLNKCSITEINPALDENIFRHETTVIPFKVSIILLENGAIGYRFNLPDGGISETLSAAEVGAISNEIFVLMETVKNYNYYLTEINLSNIDVKMYKNFSTFCFVEKNKFELLIEKGISAQWRVGQLK